MVRDYAREYFLEKKMSCAESVLRAANAQYNLGADESAFKAIASFGGGAGCGEFCGAIAGALGAVGIKYQAANGYTKEVLSEKCAEVVKKFKAQYGSELCSVLAETHKKADTRCLELVENTCDILESVM